MNEKQKRFNRFVAKTKAILNERPTDTDIERLNRVFEKDIEDEKIHPTYKIKIG